MKKVVFILIALVSLNQTMFGQSKDTVKKDTITHKIKPRHIRKKDTPLTYIATISGFILCVFILNKISESSGN